MPGAGAAGAGGAAAEPQSPPGGGFALLTTFGSSEAAVERLTETWYDGVAAACTESRPALAARARAATATGTPGASGGTPGSSGRNGYDPGCAWTRKSGSSLTANGGWAAAVDDVIEVSAARTRPAPSSSEGRPRDRPGPSSCRAHGGAERPLTPASSSSGPPRRALARPPRTRMRWPFAAAHPGSASAPRSWC